MKKPGFVIICIALFLLAVSVRMLVFQNHAATIENVQHLVTLMYKSDAQNLAAGRIGEFIAGSKPPSDAMVLAHPPGYPMVIAPVYAITGGFAAFRVFQILINSLAPVFVFMIVLRLFDRDTAIVAGALTALAPQFSYYSGMLLPDGLCVVPILVAVYMFSKSIERPRYIYAIICGIALGVSCWLRSNALLLPLFFAIAALFLLPKIVGARFSAVLLAAFVLVIAPITIRNVVIFHSFVPLSLGMGHMVVIGLAQYDEQGTLGLPRGDEDEMMADAVRNNRPDYFSQLYAPDGILRERQRLALGLTTIRENPLWYASVVIRRSLMMWRMERVPVIDRAANVTFAPSISAPLNILQRLFITPVILPLALAGIAVLIRDPKRRSSLAVLAVVPIYYMCVQSLIFTEYRFFIAASHFIVAAAAVGLVHILRFASAWVRPGLDINGHRSP